MKEVSEKTKIRLSFIPLKVRFAAKGSQKQVGLHPFGATKKRAGTSKTWFQPL
ncbi:hypothetical protein [Prevotella aurantiaca]|uniref:hypothetical protein n=1 Tax=Prevotella aurantiaca TaxID=596085 RepID=UPI000A57D122|nr:hypothetical protein [Prevotella aurantiaca]